VSELARRVIFAVAAIPVVVAAIYVGGALLATLLACVAAVAAWEFLRLARATGANQSDFLGIALAAIVPLVVHAQYLRLVTVPVTLYVLVVLAIFSIAIWTHGPERNPLRVVAVTIFGTVYVNCITYIYALRHHDYVIGGAAGTALALFPLLITWATDIGGFFVGRAVKGPRLMPRVSPSKTISGAVGGLIFAAVVGMVYVPLVLRPMAHLALRPASIILFSVIVAAVSMVGDLAESLLKREAGVKDTSHIIPGHGGVLDRIDSLLFALPVSYLLFRWMLIPVPA
jgi:phosphatidate cytidylyltransferase